MRNARTFASVVSTILCAAGTAGAQTLLYSFETLYSNPTNPVPDPMGTLPDGYHENGGGTTITQDVFGATEGGKSLKFEQVTGATFTGAVTSLGAPFDIINAPSTAAISVDLTIKAGEEFAGGFANMGITEFGTITGGEGNAQTVASAEQPIKLPPGTYHLLFPLVARFDPVTFALDVPFSSIAGPGGVLTGTSFQFYINKNAGTLTAYLDNVRAVGGQASAWNFDGDGNWTDEANWLGAPVKVPNAVGAIAVLGLGPPLSAARVITTDQAITLGTLYFNSNNPYTVGGSNALTLDVSSGQASIDVVSGSHFVAAPLVLSDDTNITVSRSDSLLRVDGPLTATGRAISKDGAGAVQFENVRASSLAVNGGAVRISQKMTAGSPTGTSKVETLSVGAAAALDVTNNAIIVDYSGASPLSTVRAMLQSGYAGGSWNGAGINSSTAATTTGGAVGSGEASEIFTTLPNTYAGQGVDATSLIIAYTLAGDANLDRIVNIGDFSLLAANFNQASVWTRGDFNYDNTTNIGDFSLLAANFNQTAARGALSAVPEAVVTAPFAAVLVGLRRVRRQSLLKK